MIITNNSNHITIICDNGGGITLQIDDGGNRWQHWSNNADQIVDDVRSYLEDGSTDGWEGNEADAHWLDPSDDDGNGYRVLSVDDLSKIEENQAWRNASDLGEAWAK